MSVAAHELAEAKRRARAEYAHMQVLDARILLLREAITTGPDLSRPMNAHSAEV